VGPSDSGRGLCLAPRGPVKLCGCGVRVLAGGPSAGWVLGYPSSFLVILMALVGHHSFMGPGPPDDMTEGQFLMRLSTLKPATGPERRARESEFICAVFPFSCAAGALALPPLIA
jgi:hypothetical protein